MAGEIVWLWRTGASVSHAFRTWPGVRYSTAVCGQSGGPWVGDQCYPPCRRCVKKINAAILGGGE